MPSANAASLGKYGDIPVSYYTGVPSIGIPIHTLSEGPLSIPISLSYHAGGIKVGEPSSWVGQNWSLQAGGMISRTVQGRADESCGGYFDIGNQVSVDPVLNCINTTNDVSNPQLATATKDGEPDIFSFSVGGYNGKFYIEAPTVVGTVITKGKAILIPKQDVKVDYTITASGNCSNVYRIQRFTLTMPDGVKYEFGSCDNSTNAIEIMRTNESNFWQANGWYLKKITSADGLNSIVLNYTAEEYRYSYRASFGSQSLSGWPKYLGGYNQNFVDIQGYRLDYIQTSTEKVTFVPGTERVTGTGADLTSTMPYPAKWLSTNDFAKRLERIKVENGTMRKDFVLSHSYFEDNDGTHKSSSYSDFRLKLNAVQEQSGDGTITVPPHTFTYYGKAGNINYLPNRLSSAIDHWGYNNDALANPHIGLNIPFTRLKYDNINTPPIIVKVNAGKGSSNRETNEEAMKWGTIQQIQYPTGGSSIFEYEANDYYDTEGRKILQDQTNYSLTHIWPGGNCESATYTDLPGVSPSSTFFITFTSQADIDAMFYKWETMHPTYNGSCNNGNSVSVTIFQGTTSLASASSSGSDYPNYNTGKGNMSDLFPNLVLQPNVQYRFEMRARNVASQFILQKEVIVEQFTSKKVGGLRIKTLTNYDGINTNNNVVKTYNYTKVVSNQTQSSGVLYQKPVYGYVFLGTIGQCNNITTGIPKTFHFFMDQSIAPLGSFEGGHLNYDRVQENAIINATTQYSTVYEFQNEPIETFTGFPITPTQPRIGSGEMRRKGSINSSGTEVASETYTPYPEPYNTFFGDYYEYGAGTYIKFNTYFTNGDPSATGISFWKKYNIRTRPYRLSQVTSVKDNITTTTDYTYLPGLLPKKTESVTNSDNVTTTTTYSYPSELGTAYAPLVAKNIILPVQTQTVTGSATKWSKVEYNALAQPTYLKECLNNADPSVSTNWITRLYIESYSAYGMPTKLWRNNALAYEQYTWNNKLLTKKELVGGASGTLTWDLAYLAGTSLVNQVTDENRLVKKYTYDPLMRLSTVQDRMKSDGSDVQTTTYYRYQYNAASVGSFVQDSTVFAGGSAPLISRKIIDGLGRTKIGMRIGYTPANQNLKSLATYDAQGRVNLSYQPYESATTLLDATPTAGTLAVQTIYEQSPLSRPIQQIMEDGKSVQTQYSSNNGGFSIRKFSVVSNGDGTNAVSPSGTYTVNSLYKTLILNENGVVANDGNTGSTTVYKDKLGQVILTRKYVKAANGSFDFVDTYNVYDDFGKLVMVIPPGATSAVTATDPINLSLVFEYNYDNRNRLTRKKVPNADWVNFYYNDRDLLTLIQDGNMRTPQYGGASNRYIGTQYDTLSRVLKTGWVTTTDPVNFAKTAFIIANDTNKLSETFYYPNRTWVKHQGVKVLKPAGVTTNRNFVWSYIERRVGYEYTGNPIWTGKQHILMPGQTERTILDADTYGVDWSAAGYNGLQKPTLSLRYLFTGTAQSEVRTYETYTYDHAQRLTSGKHYFALNGAGVAVPTFTLSNMVYNYKDQMTRHNIANVSGKYLQSIDYTYNGRGWLTGIGSVNETGNDYPIFNASTDAAAMNSPAYPSTFPLPAAMSGDDNPDLFTESISYDAPNTYIPGGATPQYNGNISQVVWQVAGREKQAYSFKYDNLDRLTEANYMDIHNTTYASHGWASLYQGDNKYQEKISYDLRGNIQSVQRNGLTNTSFGVRLAGYFGQIDNLTYTYDPTDKNKLLKVADAADLTKGFTSVNNTAATHYAYDMNGNLIADANKGITNITYNYLNLPSVITFTGNRTIKFVYDATGAKLQKIVTDNTNPATTQHYVNGIEYNGNTLERIPHTEGEIVKNAIGTYVYQYALKDHLGNRRVTFMDNVQTPGTLLASDIKQVNHFYGFGMNMEGPAYSFSGPNKTQYNEKELNTEFGLNWNDYGARFYDASIGRWTAVDPLAEMYGSMSAYHYGMNNPIKFVDPTGMASEAYSFGTSGSSGAAYDAYKKAEDRITGRDNGEAAQSDIAGTWTPYGTRAYSKGQLLNETVDGFSYTPNDGFYATYSNGKVSYQRVSGEGGNDYDVIYSGCVPCGTGSSYRIDNTSGGGRIGVGAWMPMPATGAVESVDDPFSYVDKSLFKIGAFGLKLLLSSGGKTIAASGLFIIKKAVNSNLPHAIERAVERGIFASKSEASIALKQLTNNISKSGFPDRAFLDPSKVDRVLIPIGNNGLAVYQVSKNGTAAIQTVLIAR